MGDLFKDMFEAMGARLRTPFFGSILLAFVVVNWRALMVLFFGADELPERIASFDAVTDTWSLVVLPILAGSAFAIATPWVQWLGAWLAKFPKRGMRHLQMEELQKRRIRQHELQAQESEAKARVIASRASLEAEEETRKIEAARRLEEAKAVNEDVVEELSTGRKLGVDEIIASLRHVERVYSFLQVASRSDVGQLTVNSEKDRFVPVVDGVSDLSQSETAMLSSHREKLDWDRDLELVRKNELVRSFGTDPEVFQITPKGYEFLDRFGSEIQSA